MSKIMDVNDKKAQHDVGRTLEGKTILAIYNPNNNLWFLAFKEGGQPPREFDGYFTDKARAEQYAKAYLNRCAIQRGDLPKEDSFIPVINVTGQVQQKATPATNFKSEMKKLKNELKDIPNEDSFGLVNLGKKESQPEYEVGSLKLP